MSLAGSHAAPSDEEAKLGSSHEQNDSDNAAADDDAGRGRWSEHEDSLVRSLVAQHGASSWSTIAQSVIGRSGKQCRERYAASIVAFVIAAPHAHFRTVHIFFFFSQLVQSFGPVDQQRLVERGGGLCHHSRARYLWQFMVSHRQSPSWPVRTKKKKKKKNARKRCLCS
jgi:hypothetical protein